MSSAVYHSKRKSEIAGRIIVYVLLIGLSIIFLLPFLWMLSTALKENAQLYQYPPKWIPSPPRWRNFIDAWSANAPFTLFLKNTLIITGTVLIGTILSNSIVAYSFARLRWPGRDLLFAVLLSTIMLPQQVTMIPLFILFSKLNWVNTFLPLTVPAFFGSPFFIFLLRQFFMSIPIDLDEAARIDGCNGFMIYWKIILPISKPALATVAIFSFMWTWNDFMHPLIYLNKMERYTLSLGVVLFQTRYQVYWNLLMAISLLILLPCILMFFFAQKYFIQGIVATGLKG